MSTHVVVSVEYPKLIKTLGMFDPLNDLLLDGEFLSWRQVDQRLPDCSTLYSLVDVSDGWKHETFNGTPLFSPYDMWIQKRLRNHSTLTYDHSEFRGMLGPVNGYQKLRERIRLVNRFIRLFLEGFPEYPIPPGPLTPQLEWERIQGELVEVLRMKIH